MDFTSYFAMSIWEWFLRNFGSSQPFLCIFRDFSSHGKTCLLPHSIHTLCWFRCAVVTASRSGTMLRFGTVVREVQREYFYYERFPLIGNRCIVNVNCWPFWELVDVCAISQFFVVIIFWLISRLRSLAFVVKCGFLSCLFVWLNAPLWMDVDCTVWLTNLSSSNFDYRSLLSSCIL